MPTTGLADVGAAPGNGRLTTPCGSRDLPHSAPFRAQARDRQASSTACPRGPGRSARNTRHCRHGSAVGAGARASAGYGVGAGRPRDPSPSRHRERRSVLADLRAWATALPAGSSFSHLTAARAHGLWLPPLPSDLPVFVAVPKSGVRPERPELRVTRHDTVIATCVAGLPMASAEEAILACARDLGLLDLIVLVDGALQRGRTTWSRLESVAARRRRGAPALRVALRLADGRSESPWETLLRLLHVLCEVPVQPQAKLVDVHGDFVGRADLLISGTRTAHEFDGAHHLTRDQQRRDLDRARRLRSGGLCAARLHRPRRALPRSCRPARRGPGTRPGAPARADQALARGTRAVTLHRGRRCTPSSRLAAPGKGRGMTSLGARRMQSPAPSGRPKAEGQLKSSSPVRLRLSS